MVDKTLDLLAGEVRIQVRGASVERFLNLCARSGIRLRRTGGWISANCMRLCRCAISSACAA